ncbi:MAG: restriction endonuclease subunit S [Prevotella sp.]|nr:restriction endonuclease subunit S [Prevotella sp.]
MVEWKTIDSLGSYFGGLTGKTKKDFENGNAKFITYMNVFSNPSLDVNTVGMVHINEGEKQNKVQKGDILFSGSSETPDEAGMSCVVTDELKEDFYMNSFCFGLRLTESEQYNLHFFKHVLRSHAIRQAISKSASGVTRFNISKARFGKIQIPIPPLSEQNRIVGILDTFTESIENLKKQISEREKQYEHYRDQLLDLEGKPEKDITLLGTICDMTKGNGVQKTDFVNEGIGCIHYGQIYTHYGSFTYTTNKFVSKEVFDKAKKASKGDIVMTDTSENVEDICKSVAYLGEEDIAVSNHALIIKHRQNPKFLSYSTLTKSFFNQKRKYAYGVKVTGIKPDHLAQFLIYLPSIEEQNRIVTILDTFEASIANLEQQLTHRQKQYEYYRNMLLTFDE